MDPHVLLRELWLPIVLATVLCFLGGFVLHMLLPLHKKDWAGIPGEAGVLDAMRKSGVGAGQYMFPYCSMEQMKDPEFQKKWSEGPAGVMVIMKPGKFTMTPMLVQQVLYHLVVTFLVAYLVNRTMVRGADYLQVFRVSGTAAILAYSCGVIPLKIWYRFTGGFATRVVIDGIVSGLLTAGTFGWLWPR